ncbi:IPT/TIG domain-containing protein, partial [Kitasatospora sp. NPDC056531]|uniref:IPT/TIG domain-containing protein n=1 Tax=Kitasatospora sp. NPDC056531 TaxID=3345856 RepID=UPI0036953BB9
SWAIEDPTVTVGAGPIGIAFTPSGRYAYVADNGGGTVSVIDTAALATVATVSGFSGPVGVAITPSGTRAYVSNASAGSVSVVDTATNALTGPAIAVGSSPFELAVTPDGTRVYVANHGDGTVSVIDTASNAVTATIPVGAAPNGVAVTPDGTRVYVSDYGGAAVSVISTATNTVTATVPVGAGPIGVAVTPDGTRAYVANNGDGTVSVIDTATNTVTGAPIPVGTNPAGAVRSPDGTRIWVVNFGSDSVSVISTATNTVTTTYAVGTQPSRAAITPNGLATYVTNSGTDTVSVIELPGVAPDQGPTTGGTVVTINGVNLADATAVHFGSRPATIIGDTPNQVTVISPPGTGAVDITVTTPGGTSNPAPFYYIGTPTLTSITPNTGPTAPGTTVTITGYGLTTANGVTFGTTTVRPSSTSETQLTVTAPAHGAAGTVPVTVTTAGGTADTLTYTYTNAPTLTAISPNEGPLSGGTVATVTGAALATTDRVTLAGTLVSFSVVSDTTVALTTPPGAPGPADLTITTAGGTTTLPGAFSYIFAPTV